MCVEDPFSQIWSHYIACMYMVQYYTDCKIMLKVHQYPVLDGGQVDFKLAETVKTIEAIKIWYRPYSG